MKSWVNCGGPHRLDGPADCFGCHVKGVRFDPFATPSRANFNPPKLYGNSWEKGVPTDSRNMPYLDSKLQPLTAKEWSEQGTPFIRELRAETAAATTQGA